MAFPATPTNFFVQQANGQVYLSANLTAGALSYSFKRSSDGVTFTVIGTALTPQFLDTTALLGVQYYYTMAAVNVSGTSQYTAPQIAIPAPTGEMSLGQLRLTAQQRADRVGSNFLTTPEWNSNIQQSYFELYNIIIASYEDYIMAPPVSFLVDGSKFLYPLPDGITTFTSQAGTPVVAPPFFKLMGVDLALNNANNAYVSVNKFNFIDRNRFVYPNSSSAIYGVFNLQYRLIGANIEFIPTPSAGQVIRIWYIPRLNQLLQDTDMTIIGTSGWLEYVIVDAAIKALQKEESDVSILMAQKAALYQQIMDSAMNRDVGMPDTISEVRTSGRGDGGYGGGPTGAIGGW